MQSVKRRTDKKSVIQLAISVLTAALTAICTTSCMGTRYYLYVKIKPDKVNLSGLILKLCKRLQVHFLMNWLRPFIVASRHSLRASSYLCAHRLINSTRRFWARPASVPLSATGSWLPLPTGRRLNGSTPWPSSAFTTASARSWLNGSLILSEP